MQRTSVINKKRTRTIDPWHTKWSTQTKKQQRTLKLDCLCAHTHALSLYIYIQDEENEKYITEKCEMNNTGVLFSYTI